MNTVMISLKGNTENVVKVWQREPLLTHNMKDLKKVQTQQIHCQSQVPYLLGHSDLLFLIMVFILTVLQ